MQLKSFSLKGFCTKPHVESWSHWNSEMVYSGLSLICCLLTQMKEKCHFFALCHTDIQGGGGTQQSFMLGGPTLRSKPIPFFI